VNEALVVLGAYLVGSFSFATILVKLVTGEDVRELGSGNAGATNVLRTAGKGLAAATLVLDVAKGAIGVLLMHLVTNDPRWLCAAGVAAVSGHIFPIWFRFRGGKGVATALGAFLVIEPRAVVVLVAVFFLVIALTRYVSLGSVTTACLLPAVLRFLFHAGDPEVIAGFLVAVLLVFTHRANIRRLATGTERKLGRKEPPE